MVFYLDNSGNSLSQAWNGDKMLKDVPNHLLTPMIRHKAVIYYVNELVQCKCGGWFIPKQWVMKNSSLHAVGHLVTECEVHYYAMFYNCMLYDVLFAFSVQDCPGLNVEADYLQTVEVSTFSANIETILSSNAGVNPFSGLFSHVSCSDLI